MYLDEKDRIRFWGEQTICHAPLLMHNPERNTGQPYLHRDEKIQGIVDRTGRIVVLSGHTHSSPDILNENWESVRVIIIPSTVYNPTFRILPAND